MSYILEYNKYFCEFIIKSAVFYFVLGASENLIFFIISVDSIYSSLLVIIDLAFWKPCVAYRTNVAVRYVFYGAIYVAINLCEIFFWTKLDCVTTYLAIIAFPEWTNLMKGKYEKIVQRLLSDLACRAINRIFYEIFEFFPKFRATDFTFAPERKHIRIICAAAALYYFNRGAFFIYFLARCPRFFNNVVTISEVIAIIKEKDWSKFDDPALLKCIILHLLSRDNSRNCFARAKKIIKKKILLFSAILTLQKFFYYNIFVLYFDCFIVILSSNKKVSKTGLAIYFIAAMASLFSDQNLINMTCVFICLQFAYVSDKIAFSFLFFLYKAAARGMRNVTKYNRQNQNLILATIFISRVEPKIAIAFTVLAQDRAVYFILALAGAFSNNNLFHLILVAIIVYVALNIMHYAKEREEKKERILSKICDEFHVC